MLIKCCESAKGNNAGLCVVTCGMPDCVLSLVGCRTVCCHLWDAGLCCHLWDAGLCVVTCGMQDCVLSLVGCRTVCCHFCESCIQILSASHILDISGGKGQLLVS